ncbi:MAG: hypothetical protein LBD23_11245 [Oscillospiraceae bacterium]|nr:hypothetical protein [Oscillospiraceae bacterium]
MAIQFTALGMSGSGKTCYMLGMYYKMCGAYKGYTLKANDDTDVHLRNTYEMMRDAKKGVERFPMGTDGVSEYVFDLQYAFSSIMDFKWIDYPGGALVNKKSGNIESYNKICSTIKNSSTLFIFVDGSYLIGDDNDEKINSIQHECASTINHFFSDYKKDNGVIPPVAIVITKYDLCASYYQNRETELHYIMEEAFNALFSRRE